MRPLPANFTQEGDLNEIIFANRNKAYGAYELRKHYDVRLLKAFLLTASTVLAFLLLLSYRLHHDHRNNSNFLFPPGTIDSIHNVMIEPVKAQPHKQPAGQSHAQKLPTRIVQDSVLYKKEKRDTAALIYTPSDSQGKVGDSTSFGTLLPGKGLLHDTTNTAGGGAGENFTLVPEVYPSFPGGAKAFSKYVQRHFSCDGKGIQGATEGKIILRFIVSRDGTVSNVEVLRDNVGIDCATDAQRMLSNSPKWNPGMQNNQPVNVMMVLPITVMKQ